MLPADIIGAHIYSPAKQQFDFIAGPIFADFILADEVNRTPPRTQSALLEAMEEHQVTVEGKRFPLSSDFFVIGTQNPQDYEGTFPLPEAQIDRFLLKLVLSHAPRDVESEMLWGFVNETLPPPFEKITSIDYERRKLDSEISSVQVDSGIITYISAILEQTRKHPALSFGSSIRGGTALLKSSRVLALLRGRKFVTPDDIKALAIPTLRHRVRLNPEAQVSGSSDESIIHEILTRVEFPA